MVLSGAMTLAAKVSAIRDGSVVGEPEKWQHNEISHTPWSVNLITDDGREESAAKRHRLHDVLPQRVVQGPCHSWKPGYPPSFDRFLCCIMSMLS